MGLQFDRLIARAKSVDILTYYYNHIIPALRQSGLQGFTFSNEWQFGICQLPLTYSRTPPFPTSSKFFVSQNPITTEFRK